MQTSVIMYIHCTLMQALVSLHLLIKLFSFKILTGRPFKNLSWIKTKQSCGNSLRTITVKRPSNCWEWFLRNRLTFVPSKHVWKANPHPCTMRSSQIAAKYFTLLVVFDYLFLALNSKETRLEGPLPFFLHSKPQIL